ncbi:MAG TPA: hypothetical protein PKD00_10525 [Burkholderiales bacterium]|nr:hypothetical protein [Burkholderiales bacterium]
MKIQITFEMNIDASDDIQLESIIDDMNYDFSYVKMEEYVGGALYEEEKINSYKLLDYKIIEDSTPKLTHIENLIYLIEKFLESDHPIINSSSFKTLKSNIETL